MKAAQPFTQTTSALAVPDEANWQPAGMVLLDLS